MRRNDHTYPHIPESSCDALRGAQRHLTRALAHISTHSADALLRASGVYQTHIRARASARPRMTQTGNRAHWHTYTGIYGCMRRSERPDTCTDAGLHVHIGGGKNFAVAPTRPTPFLGVKILHHVRTRATQSRGSEVFRAPMHEGYPVFWG